MLKIDRISSRYAQVQVLNDVSLEVREGEVLGLLGRNGAGKSTLLKSIMGLVDVNSGSISMDDVILSELQAHQIPKKGIGYVPQGRRLFSELTVEENLKMGLLVRYSSKEVLEWALSLFPVLKTRMSQKSGTLSGGEQQMVATARALCIQPKLLLMDEPSEGLMPSMIETIFETIEKLKKEKVGVLLVEQKIEGTLRVSDRIVFMENGFMREESDPQALVKNPEPLAKYVGVKAHVQ
ncbi:MAG: ABC transporter ATP-binding protein [SAR324 cluster bacterium]|jgi:branched-chain amino acid transport system ATP-binding protein|nr:ABC transporter ATP-binding protein [SAR324 cluster bacterium]MDP6655109.1 ABC transporter ATP-binding protein [SAR324 cluster bacterium]MDP6743073.1 ABC transporter ATP-binding protein [SAR324 cluster bacterium]MDP7047616.1 ABC transporter ATP-binding protein [SAR324 cluster bacterium]MDP7615073.1 ABC transporter ATP-binding protein [SAR324 cluster bacterium]|tara:strand:+ start:9542 stop:10252 length:711 start_codon:yes stop_codon:yes gene_type:complete